MTLLVFFLAAPVFLVLSVRAVNPKPITLGQDDQVNIQCAPATMTAIITATTKVTSTVTVSIPGPAVTQTVTSSVTFSIAGPGASQTLTSNVTSSSPESTSSASQSSPTNNNTGGGSPRSTYQNSVYFFNTVKEAKFEPGQLPVNNVSHILYAFADIGQYGEVKSSDRNVDIEQRFATDSFKEAGNNVYGCVKQLYLLKKKKRSLKVLLTIGGGGDGTKKPSDKFAEVAASMAGRRLFAESAAALVGDWGFDGIDIDWEFPADARQAADFSKLLKACRDELDRYAAQHAPGYHFLITVAAPGDAYDMKLLDLAGMKPWVDHWHLMTYDYIPDPNGPYRKTTAHTTNLYADPENPLNTPESTDGAVKYYLAGGIAPASISIGLPIYGHIFKTTDGIGSPFDETDTLSYKNLPKPGAEEQYDEVVGASYSYDNQTRELISYDTPASTAKKADYLRSNGLGGAFFFEASSDKTGDRSLVAAAAGQLGLLDPTQNLLNYPASKYDNIRTGVPGG